MRQPKTTAFWVDRLPHWEVEDGRYFITIHLAGAIPRQGQQRVRELSAQLHRVAASDPASRLNIQRLIFREMEAWLDRAHWHPYLQNDDIARLIVEAIEHREKTGQWQMFEYVLMPTHIHLFCTVGEMGLKGTMEDFKRWTGHCAAKILGGESERFWQREWFDHWSRSDDEDDKIVEYIRRNPVKANLVNDYRTWPYGSWSRSRLPGGTSNVQGRVLSRNLL